MISSAAEFYRLRESSKPEEYRRAAHEEASIETWMEVIGQRPDMRFWAAQNKTVPVEVLEILASDGDVTVRDMVARKRKITEAIALKLAEDPDETVRAALAINRKLPPSALAKLKQDQSSLVLAALEKQFG
ncbi:HEAT repeat domain-containing protein [Haloferula chungangensis]|uniref:HEAT repeat domain-containing protein n=1 Tax=Haloferula chungangensis TaxID=1048331 RepID=A0ABW2LEB3_9BACT